VDHNLTQNCTETIEQFPTSQFDGPYPRRAKWRLIRMGVIRAATLPDLFIGRHYAVAVFVEIGLLDYFLN